MKGGWRPAVRLLSQLILAAVGTVASGALAGDGLNVLVVVDPSRADALHIANVYRTLRGIPACNILFFDPAASHHAEWAETDLPVLLGTLESRLIADHIDYIVVAPSKTFYVPVSSTISDGCSPVTRIALPSLYTLAFVTDEVLAGQAVTTPNRYFGATSTIPAFSSQVAWLGGSPSTHQFARRYFIGAMLGYTGNNGNTVEEILDMIAGSVAAEGTRPAGTFYFMDNQADPARNVRAPLFPSIVSLINGLGLVQSGSIIQGVLPIGQHDALGILTGAATPNITGANYTLYQGTFADHLTSWAATFDKSSQTKVSDWIRVGAAGSHGAVEEPCNYLGKFPNPRIQYHYLLGATLGEAWFRSLQYQPYQTVFYGDPLARTFAHVPTVEVPDAPTGGVAGTVQITPEAQTTHPSATILWFDAYIDGVYHSTAVPGGKVTIDTTELADGWHELRVVAHDNTPLQTSGTWTGPLVVGNAGLSVSVAPQMASGDLGTEFLFDLGSAGGNVVEVRLLHNGRVLGALAGGSGTLGVTGAIMGAGPVEVQAEAEFDDGSIVRSEPAVITIASTGGGAGGAAPVAYRYRKHAPKDQPFVVELPASFFDDLGTASYTITTHPYQATLLLDENAPYAYYEPMPGAHDVDELTFRVQTPSGQSGLVTIDVVYSGCAADMDNSGTLDLFDFLTFTNLFGSQTPTADFDRDGQFTLFDFLEFSNRFVAGC